VANIFVSYARPDVAWALWIAATLEGLGRTTVYQERDFLPGESFTRRMDEALKSDHVVAVLSEDYLVSDDCRAERDAMI
jgi:hypothetical protein